LVGLHSCGAVGTLVIPDAVYHEVVVAGRGQPGAAEVEQADWITRETVSNPTVIAALHELGRGEAEAVALAVKNPGALLILDERRGRLAALTLTEVFR
jgi:predicted nucleic acid-binding protein